MIVNVIAKSNDKDSFELKESLNSKTLILPSFYMNADNKILRSDITRILKNSDLSPESIVTELFNLFYIVYAADQLVSRTRFGYFSWSRNFVLYLPVQNPQVWEAKNKDIIRLLSFLSGDHWDVKYRQKEELDLKTKVKKKAKKIEAVSLFSGGLDSLTGVINILEDKSNLALVGHHKGGGTDELTTQNNLFSKLKIHYKKLNIESHFFNVQPMQKNNDLGGEDTQRARSILFLGLGIMVANSYGNIPLYVPENGLISLNVPLTNARLSTYSTRTTHPNFLNILEDILKYFKIDVTIRNPFQYHTKGELINDCANFNLIKKLYPESISCSKPYYYRRYKKVNLAHCGHCTPCIIRRASLNHVGLDNPKDYAFDIVKIPFPNNLKSGRDARAFKIGIARTLKDKESLEFRLLKSGYIPSGIDNISKFTKVLLRGTEEVNSLFKKT